MTATEIWTLVGKIAWFLALIVTCSYISIKDIKSRIIENTALTALAIIGLLGFLLMSDVYSMAVAGISFAVLLVIGFILFKVLGEDSFGGGDAKMMAVSGLFICNANSMLYYAISMLAFSIILFIYCKKIKSNTAPAGPLYAASLITMVGLNYFGWYGFAFLGAFIAFLAYRIYTLIRKGKMSKNDFANADSKLLPETNGEGAGAKADNKDESNDHRSGGEKE
jgi:Flp pilus assembly protein protease CpaA